MSTTTSFHNPTLFAIVPMDSYYPGKGETDDLPQRGDFAPRWHLRILAGMPDIILRVLIGRHAHWFYPAGRAQATSLRLCIPIANPSPAEFPLVHPSPLNHRWHPNTPWFTAEAVPELARQLSILLGHR